MGDEKGRGTRVVVVARWRGGITGAKKVLSRFMLPTLHAQKQKGRELFPKKVSSRERRVSALLPFLNNKWEVRGREKVTVAADMGLQDRNNKKGIQRKKRSKLN